MKASILSKLDHLAERYEEVGALLSDGDIISDQNRFRSLSKEYAELEPLVQHYAKYRIALDNIEQAKLLLKDADPDMRGKGVGRALIEAVYQAADQAGAPGVYWMTQDFNTTARQLYDRIGTLSPFIKYIRV